MYLFAVMSLYYSCVPGWDLSNTVTAEWCAGVPEEARARNGKPEIINSDQGSQFTASCY
jgi:putative transposase